MSSERPRGDLTRIMAYAIVRTAELLVAAGGYDAGDPVDLPEQAAFAVTAEIYRRGLVAAGTSSCAYSRRTYAIRLTVDGELSLGEDGTPAAYRELRLLMSPQAFRDMRALAPGQFAAVLAHTIVSLHGFLAEVYDDLPDTTSALGARESMAELGVDAFENLHVWDQIRFVQRAVAKLAQIVTSRRLDASYQKGYLYTS